MLRKSYFRGVLMLHAASDARAHIQVMVQSNPFLIGRFLDPLFAVAVGIMSYYSYERKVGRPEGHSLNELAAKKWKQIRSSKSSQV